MLKIKILKSFAQHTIILEMEMGVVMNTTILAKSVCISTAVQIVGRKDSQTGVIKLFIVGMGIRTTILQIQTQLQVLPQLFRPRPQW